MGILGKGRGFLGLSKKYNSLISVIIGILGLGGIIYFVKTNQPILVLGTIGVTLSIIGSILRREK